MDKKNTDPNSPARLYSSLPSMDKMLEALERRGEFCTYPRALIKELADDFLQECREKIRTGMIQNSEQLSEFNLLDEAVTFIHDRSRPHLRPVINATGVVVHTNLGRSLLGREAMEAVQEVCTRYTNLEFSLETGKRGSRYSHVEGLLCRLTGAEAGLVVNNNAAAVLLILDTLAKGKEVIVSRGELVEIGGSFRIPDVMTKSGAVLREVGATNRTHLADYERAIGPETGAFLKAHTSNFRIIGFHKSVSIPELKSLGRTHDLPVIEDLGSGNLYPFTGLPEMDEPLVQERIKQGVDVLCFSGDKLLGGPQAGIILGRKKYIDPIKKNPLNRALRIDKMTLAALEATLKYYYDPETARREIPALSMITAGPKKLAARAGRLAGMIRKKTGSFYEVEVKPSESRVGGGAFPEKGLASTVVRIRSRDMSLEELRQALLHTDPPVIGRIESDWFSLDPRTVLPEEFSVLVRALEGVADGFSA